MCTQEIPFHVFTVHKHVSREKKCYVQNASDELLAQLGLLKSNAIPLHRQVGEVHTLAEGTLTLA